MSTGVKKTLAVLVVLVIILGWYVTIFGIGPIPAIKDKIKLGLDIKGGVYVVMEAETNVTGEELKSLMEQTQAVIEERVNQMGLSEPVVTIEGTKRVRVELPGVESSSDAIESIGRTAQLVFTLADGTKVLDGGMVKTATFGQDTQKGGYAVNLEFDKSGRQAFADATTKALSGQVTSTIQGVPNAAIVISLDGKIISSPVPSEVISGGSAQISGNFTQDEAVNLAALIRGGALPVSLTEVMTSNRTAEIGVDALVWCIVAGLIGLILIMIIMSVAYRIMGIAANIALLLYVLIVLWIMAGIGSVLTLPGIAGIILSVGMAVDANVIIFSRIREEICNGKTIRVSIQSGFQRAISTILDSQITTIIAAVVLYQFGTGPVKGFAMTLMIGIVASVFTAVVITQLYVSLLGDSKRFAKKKFFGIKENGMATFAFKKEFNIIKHRKKYYVILLAILVIGLGIGGIRGFNYGIDFTGGTMMQVEVGQGATTDSVQKIMKANDIDAKIVYAGENQEQVIIRTIQSLDNQAREQIITDMTKDLGITEEDVLSIEQFGPSIGKELKRNAINAVLISALGMLIYIVIRFEWKFGVASLAGVAHDVLMVIAFYGIFNVTINNPFIAGILTVVGYSINDTIVVFDRVRENIGIMKKNKTEELVDKSINQTLGRSLMTSFTTIVVMVPLFFLTGESVREFTMPLMIGIIVGCASSIFVCSPIYYELCQLTGGPRYKSAKSKKKD